MRNIISLEEKRRIVAEVDRLREKEGITVVEAAKKRGINWTIYYMYKGYLRKHAVNMYQLAPHKVVEGQVVGLQFSVIPAEEARASIRSCKDSRFSELRNGLINQLKTLRKSEALMFPAKNPEDKKERNSIMTSCNNAIKLVSYPWKVRWSADKKMFIVIHNDKLSKNNEEAN